MKLKQYLDEYERDYKDEYDKFQSSKKQKQQRAMRNNARRNSNCEKGDGKEIDHIIPLAKGGTNDKENQRVVSQKTNRAKGKK